MTRLLTTLILIIVVLSSNLIFIKFLEAYRFSYIVIHHTASIKDNYVSIKKYQRKRRGWDEPAYHLILSNGSTNIRKGYLEATSRYENLSKSVASKSTRCNYFGLHLVVVGNYHKEQVSKKMKSYLKGAILILQKKFFIPQKNVILHRDCSKTLCPGKFIKRKKIHDWLEDSSIKISKKIEEQQIEVIENAYFNLYSLKRFAGYLVIFNLIILVLFYLIFLIIFRELREKT